ncbi:MAG TPA: SPOR domain-containing protein [Gammaproteobacteria bacterium]|nr:SPOR domain-containing protein [Gammaproteobacteria bacterium]
MEIGLKERLIGAVVLVILGVIIIPFFLKGSPAPDAAVNQTLTLPPGGSTAVQQVTLPLTPGAAPAAAAPAAGTRIATAAMPVTSPVPAVHPIQRPAAPAAQPEGKWLVQAGSYSSESNADKVVKTLEQHGFRASVSRILKSGHSYYRVRVGPYAARADADKAAAAVAKAYAGKAEVVPND